MGVFDKIKTGLEEDIAYDQGILEVKTRKMTVQPISHYDAAEIRTIRASTGMTQAVFGEFMGVSVKTIEARESGRNYPIECVYSGKELVFNLTSSVGSL